MEEIRKDASRQSPVGGVDIFSYLTKVKIDFEEFVNESIKEHTDLSFLNLNYSDREKPDYTNLHVQQYYLLRYGFGYTYMYKCMYECILKDINAQQKFIKNGMEVLSAGCGARLDYLGLIYALRDLKVEDKINITYHAIDLAKWEYPIYGRTVDIIDPKIPERINITGYLESLNELTSDIIVFPFSISEFSDEDFQFICDEIAEKSQKDDVYIMTTLRYKETLLDESAKVTSPHDIRTSNDYRRSEEICKKMKDAGYTPHEVEEPAKDMTNERIKLPNIESKEKTLYQEIRYLRRWESKNGLFDVLEENCRSLNKSPMTKKSSIRYRIIHFIR